MPTPLPALYPYLLAKFSNSGANLFFINLTLSSLISVSSQGLILFTFSIANFLVVFSLLNKTPCPPIRLVIFSCSLYRVASSSSIVFFLPPPNPLSGFNAFDLSSSKVSIIALLCADAIFNGISSPAFASVFLASSIALIKALPVFFCSGVACFHICILSFNTSILEPNLAILLVPLISNLFIRSSTLSTVKPLGSLTPVFFNSILISSWSALISSPYFCFHFNKAVLTSSPCSSLNPLKSLYQTSVASSACLFIKFLAPYTISAKPSATPFFGLNAVVKALPKLSTDIFIL